jgi:hypothetical protein
MPDASAASDADTHHRAGIAGVAYWLVAGAIYVALGVAAPPALLLGFQEAAVYVFVVTALQPKVLRRFR